MEITFTHPYYLLLLFSIPILVITHFLSIRYTSKKALKFANFPAIEKITGEKLITKNTTILVTRSIILILAIMAAAGSTLVINKQTTNTDFVLAIDASSSMLATDYSPNRLEAAKQAALSFISNLPSNTPIAIVSFAGTSFVDSQLTDDHSKAKAAINNIEAKRVGGTDIGGAIINSANLLSSSKNSKAVILLTDGRSNVGQSLEEAIEYANDNKITVNTIGIGTAAGGQITEDILLTLDEETIKNIAIKTSGKYIFAEDSNQLSDAYLTLLDLSTGKVPINLSIIFLISAIILLLVEWGLINTRYKILP